MSTASMMTFAGKFGAPAAVAPKPSRDPSAVSAAAAEFVALLAVDAPLPAEPVAPGQVPEGLPRPDAQPRTGDTVSKNVVKPGLVTPSNGRSGTVTPGAASAADPAERAATGDGAVPTRRDGAAIEIRMPGQAISVVDDAQPAPRVAAARPVVPEPISQTAGPVEEDAASSEPTAPQVTGDGPQTSSPGPAAQSPAGAADPGSPQPDAPAPAAEVSSAAQNTTARAPEPTLRFETAAKADAPAEPDAPAVNTDRVATRAAGHLAGKGLGGGAEPLKLSLTPPHLGRLEIQFSQQGETLVVRFQVEGVEAQEALRQAAADLTQMLTGREGGWREVQVEIAREDQRGDREERRERGSGDRSGSDRDEADAQEERS